MNIQEMRNIRATKAREMRTLSEMPAEKWTTEAQQKFAALESEVLALDRQIDAYNAALDGAAARLQGSTTQLFNFKNLDAIGRFAVVGDRSGFGFQAAITEGADSGGVLVPHEIAAEIMAVAKKYSPIRDICKVVTIKTAASKYVQPVVKNGAAAGWVGETDARPETTAPAIDGIEFPDAEMYCNVPVTAWADEDTAVGQLVVQEIGKAFGRQEGAAFLSGTGAKQPVGLLHGTPTAEDDATRAFGTLEYVNSGDAVTVTGDGLISLLYRVLPEYRANGSWIMNSTTVAAVRKLKDNNGNYLWADSLAPGQPAMLLGYQVVECNNMADIAADAFPIAFGDFMSGYCIVDRSMVLLRDPYSAKPYVQIYGRKRVSGNVVDSNAIKLLKIAA